MNDKMDFHRLLQHKQQRWQRSSYLLIGLFLSVCVLYLLVGELWLSPFSAWSSLEQQLVWELRLPRLLAAAVIGASLAVAGATLQVLLGNVLAEPGVVGGIGWCKRGDGDSAAVFPEFKFPRGFYGGRGIGRAAVYVALGGDGS